LLLQRVSFLTHFVLLLLYLLELNLLIDVGSVVSLLLLTDHIINLGFLIIDFIKLCVHFPKFLFHSRCITRVKIDFCCIGTERCPKEKLAIANATCSSHFVYALDLTQG